MAATVISDLFTPDVWSEGIREKANKFPAAINSGAVVKSPQFDMLASGGGTGVNVPFFKDISDQADAIQVEGTAPTVQNITTGTQVAPVLNRVTANGVEALAAAVSGTDPVGEILDQIAARRLKQRQTTFLNLLLGAFGNAGGSPVLAAARKDSFVESTGSQTAAHLIDADLIIDTWALLGEAQDQLMGGVMLCHPDIRAALLKQDETSFHRPSEGSMDVERYRGIPLFVNSSLSRAGTTSGTVYSTYFLTSGAVAYGEKPQVGDQIDVASLQLDMEKDKNREVIYDRTRFLMHLNGLKWTGTPSGQSATNAELATITNWSLVYSSADRVGACALLTNG